MIKAIIFDLDGTLLETLTDLKDSINEALMMNGYSKQYDYEEAKYLVGAGTRTLVSRALAYISHTLEDEEKVFSDFSSCYKIRQFNHTVPYKDIPEVVDILNKHNYELYVLTNKVEANTLALMNKLFKPNSFKEIVGQRVGVPLKPDPTSLFALLDRHNLNKDEVIYVGDSDTDMKEGLNAGVKYIGVSYGFRKKEEISIYNPLMIVDTPLELLEAILSLN